MQREGVEKPKYYIDTLKVAQTYIDLPSYKLQYLRYYFGLEIEAVAHDAYGDILVLKEVFFKLLSVMQETEKLTDQEAIAKMVQISKNPVEVRRFTFGKHKGKTFAEVSSFDIAYLQWLKSDTLKKPKEEQDENLIYTLSLYL